MDESVLEHIDESVLEYILNGHAEPKDLPLPLLKHITKNFAEERKIGHGGFSEVYKGILRNGILVAVKSINVNQHTIDDKLFRREFNSLRKIDHPNLVRFLGFCSNSYQTTIKESTSDEDNLVNVRERLLCFEYVNGSLDNHITDELRGLEWETRFEIIIGICKGLRYLHLEKEIVHMDLKPQNILLDRTNMIPKITDFGLSRPNKKTHTSTDVRFGTRGYLAPEYLKDGKTSVKSDIYSLGAIIIELVTGILDVPDKNNVLRRWIHRWNEPPTLLQYEQLTRCIDIAVRCRQLEPRDRPSISEIINTLSKSESTDGHNDQMSPCFNLDGMLGIKPLELHVHPSERTEEISCSIVELTNDTCNFMAFNIQLPSIQRYNAQPQKGIVQPNSKYDVKITMQAREVHEHNHLEKITVQSRKISDGLRDEDIRERMFNEDQAGDVVDEVSLMVVYETASGQRELGIMHPKRAIISRHYSFNMMYIGNERHRAVDVTRGALGSLLDKLGKLVTKDYNLDNRMKEDIESFSQDLMKMRLDLPKLENIDWVKVWVNEVRELSYKIEDMVDDFLVHVEHDSNSSAFRELLHDCPNLLENGNYQIGDVIRDIKSKVQAVAKKGERYISDVQNDIANETAKATIDLQNLAIYKDKEQLIGIEAPRDELIRLFEDDGDVPKQSLKILPIVGMGGVGKSALAKAVYDKLQTKHRPRAFVTVGQNADVKIVLKNILTECLKGGTNLEHLDVPQLINQLHELLKDKSYFIVIDGIWEAETWDAISPAFPRNNHGSRVITTTREFTVATASSSSIRKYNYQMKTLSKEDSRRLFFRRIFGPKETCPDALKDISIDILKICGGLPLAINCIASVLAGYQPRPIWENVRKNWAAVINGNDLKKMNQILDLSYMHLTDFVKPCLLHVGMYQDPDIDMKDLYRQWVAEGFMHNGEMTADAAAEMCLGELMAVSILSVRDFEFDKESGKLSSFRVHPIMLDLIRSKSSEEKFTHVIDGSKVERGGIHRVSVHRNDKEDERILEAIKEGSLSHVRSVSLYRSSLVPYFLQFKYVRVLFIKDKVFPKGLDLTGISRLFLLRYLKVTSVQQSGYELKLPDQIGMLQELETIDLHNASLKNYPSDIVSLLWLSYLSSTGNEAGVVLPDGIERLKYLHTLVGVDVFESSVQNINGLSKLTKLRKLHVCWSGTTVEPTTSTFHMNALHSSISMVSASLRILTLEGFFPQPSRIPLFPGGSHIQELDLGWCEFESCPEWIGQLHHLYKLRMLISSEVANCITIVAGLPSLGYFHLMTPPRYKDKDESIYIPGGWAFRALKHMFFFCPFTTLIFEDGSMPKLEYLSIVFRPEMSRRYLPVGVNHLPAGTLQEIMLCVLPGGVRGPQAIRQHRTKVRLMLKETFRPHHQAAQILFVFDDTPVLIDEEDGYSEATSSTGATSGCRTM